MTREEAHEILIRGLLNSTEKLWCEAFVMAIKALEQELCDDVVSRQAALASIKNLYPDMPIMDIMGARRKWLEKYAPYFECENAIEQLPPVTQKSGKWIRHDNGKYHWFLCSCCDAMAGSDEKRIAYRFCPNCGARMESEE